MSNVIDTPLTDRQILSGILDQHPMLSWRGWWSAWNDRNEPAGTLERVRDETLDDYGVAQFRRALAFLEIAPRIRKVNTSRSTYSWKHAVERWHRREGAPYEDTYCGEGSFIAACLSSGMLIRRSEWSTFTNLSERAWALGEHRG